MSRPIIGHVVPATFNFACAPISFRTKKGPLEKLGERPFVPVQPEPEWRPYEPQREEA